VDQLRIGLVGAGPWARKVHGPGLVAHPGVQLAGVWARRPEAAGGLAAELGARAYGGFDELLDAVDAVAFAVPPQVQGELAVRAAAAGRHVVCEKPLAGSVEDARAVVAGVRRGGVHSSMVLTLRHAPAVRAWLAALPSEPPGRGTVAAARWLSGALLGGPYAVSPWRAERGSSLLDIGPHVIDLLDAAVGPVTSVAWAHHDEPDLWRFGLTHEGGAVSSATLSMRLPIDPTEVEFIVLGAAGRHRLADRAAAEPGTCYAHLLDEFVAAVDGSGAPPALDAVHGLRLQELVEEVYAVASRGGGPVHPS
jgi:predicted dehydrogenase